MKQKMEDHLKSSVVVQEEVMLKNPIIKQRFPDLLKIINIEDINPRTRFLKSSNQSILLQGSKAEVTRVKKALEKNLGNLKHEILTLPSPGASEFFTENGQEYLATIERRNNCITTWSCRDALNIGGTQSRPQEEDFITDTWCIFQLEGGYIVSVCQGDITKQRVDAIVNAANEDLIHAGGVAQAISMAGGPVIQKESRDWVKHRGKVLTGQAAITSAGTLPCQKVIHAVGPKCKADGKGKWDHSQNEGLLKSAITRSLMLAEQGNFRSVALPCLSSGIFGIPVVLCATWIVEAIKVHTEAYARVDHALREVMLIDVKKETVAEFQTACVKNWGSRISSLHSKDSNQSHTGRPQAAEVVFISGNLEEQLANVLVVPVLAKNPTLTSMRVGECLLKKIGGNFGALFSMLMKGRQLDPGNLLQVNTSVNDHVCCQAVLILMCSPWDGANGAAAKALRNGFSSCLHKCDHLKVKSVAFPVIGPGLTLKFPRDVVARIFFEEVKMFRGAHPGTALEEIQIVIHPEDLHSLSVFQDTQREVDMKGRPLPTSPEEGLLSCLVDDIQAMVGGVRLQVVFSDIVKETTDVIVNSTNFQSWNSQSVANAIFSATNPEIAEEVKKAKLPVDEVFVTASGGLQCRQLFHVCGQNKAQNIKSVVKKVMRKCEEIGFSSVAFPAIGTGEGKMEPGVVATAMLDAVLSVARCESLNSLKHVRIVAFQQAVFNALKWELQNRVGHLDKSKKKIISGLLKSLKSRLLKTVPQKNEMFESPRTHSEVVFEILGLSSSSIEAAKREIEEVFQKNYRDEVLQVESIARLRTEEIQQILGLGEAFRVHVTVERGQVNRIRLQGYEKQVMEVLREVMEKLKYLLESHLEEVEWERLSMLVQWMYQKDEEYLPLDPRANCLLEIGLSEQVPGQPSTVQVSLGGEEAQADLSRMEATIVRTRAVVKLKREDRALGFNNPAKWDAMSGQLLTLVDLGQGTQEFRDVQQNFMRTANGHHIIKVQRIQNLHLRHVYELRKEYIAEKNGQGELNERVLFHGTMPETCASINLYGFNRSYAGQNATAYGVGVYFAVHASYSANNTYSKPDPQTRHKFMYQVRVVAGRYTTGNSSMKVPPARPGTDPNDRYDSLVDKIENPTMYVVFHDDQAYPEYLITFM
ncbi:protein mono-ADP-ribosyltransferase PARP14-like [Rhinatrema bivittatum]|uniref:protein mono-ADP-ribosyltransferase PARP14-like n=1 Tax=Rhinatrema bivittatum TaxID=194408 RepID=UPI00112E6A27|nr:protein mono-ADP-ribosyltransferase PARP14-like [Rhinatrema bivittatum]